MFDRGGVILENSVPKKISNFLNKKSHDFWNSEQISQDWDELNDVFLYWMERARIRMVK